MWLVLLAVISPRLPAQSQAFIADPSTTALAPGDLLRITVWRQKELSCDCVIGSDGRLAHPLYRELSVTGVPLDTLERRLGSFLTKYETNPTFVLEPLFRVIVAGEVRQPNVLTLAPGTTVAQAVALAGGPTERGRLDRVRILRRRGEQIVDLTGPDQQTPATLVRSGDEILVERSRDLLRDILAPSSSVIAALASITAVIVQLSK